MTGPVCAIGDSVMQGAGPDLYGTLPARWPGIEVDALPNRQMWHAPSIVAARLEREDRPRAFIVHLGTNGLFSEATFDEVVAAAGGVPAVFVTIKAPRAWEAPVNDRLTRGVARHTPRVHLVDWYAVATTGPPELLCTDGFHLSRSGAAAYADAVVAALAPLTVPGRIIG